MQLEGFITSGPRRYTYLSLLPSSFVLFVFLRLSFSGLLGGESLT